MTTIIGVQGDTFTLLCADSRIVQADEDGSNAMITTAGPGQTKIFTKGKYILGAAGDVRAINLIQHVLNPPQPPASLKGKKLDEFITAKFIPSLKECFEANGFVAGSQDGRPVQAESNANVMLSVNSTIYAIGTDYAWFSDATGLYAVGTGSGYAMAALSALMPKSPNVKQAKMIALKAISIAAKYDPNTGGPFNTLIQEQAVKPSE